MCTIVLLRNAVPGYPLAIVANRDEYLDRPSETVLERENGLILAPKDLKRGGTWIGVNKWGVFAGLTNRNGVVGKPERVSRGDLPNLALGERTAEAAFRKIRDTFLTGNRLNGFYLVIADRENAYLFGGDGLHLTHRVVEEEVLAVTNRGVGTVGDVGLPETPRRVSHIISQWQGMQYLFSGSYQWSPERNEEEVVTTLKNLISIHDEDRHGTCVNEPEIGYGTKSSSIILLKPEPEDPKADLEWVYSHRERQGDGHVCDLPFTTEYWSSYADYPPVEVK